MSNPFVFGVPVEGANFTIANQIVLIAELIKEEDALKNFKQAAKLYIDKLSIENLRLPEVQDRKLEMSI